MAHPHQRHRPICYFCQLPGHLKKNCPKIQCHHCGLRGHMKNNCKVLQDEKEAARIAEEQVANFFKTTPQMETTPWNIYIERSRRSSVCSSDTGLPNPKSPIKEPVPESDVRCAEAVDRVADVLFKELNTAQTPVHIFRNKDFRNFYNRKKQILAIPEEAKDLANGDFDIVILHSVYGYIHIEVKATGCFPNDVDENDAKEILINVLSLKLLKELKKGRKALEYLQPRGENVNIISAFALPNIKREFLKKAFDEQPKLCKELKEVLDASSNIRTGIENLCLCSDDLPAKDSTCVEYTEQVQQAVKRWWKRVTSGTPVTRRPSRKAFRTVLAGFCQHEKIRTVYEYACEVGKRFGQLELNEQQSKVIAMQDRYVFITGPPGCGKSIVLAEKALQWLETGEAVFLLYKDGPCTSQPATECLKQYIREISKMDDLDTELPKLRSFGVPSDANIEDSIVDIIQEFCIMTNPGTEDGYRKPRRFKRLQDDSETLVPPDVDELKTSFPNFDLMSPITAVKPPEIQTNSGERFHFQGQGLNIIVDEITWRTINGKRAKLVTAITAQLPEATIWSAGPFPTDSPTGFRVETLNHPYRCPPVIQRLLRPLELFCHGGNDCVHDYCTKSTSQTRVPSTSIRDRQYMFPCQGVSPIFLSHAHHGSGEIIDCKMCAVNLVHFLKEELRIQKSTDEDQYLTEKDVMIVLTGIETCNNMSHVAFSELFRQLTSSTLPNDQPQFDVKIYENSMQNVYDAQASKMTILHVRAVGGLEKKVVVFVPCCKYRQYGGAPRAPTYAETVSRKPGARPEDPLEKLLQCLDLPAHHRQALAGMGKLNLHWLWHVASRTISQLVICHF